MTRTFFEYWMREVRWCLMNHVAGLRDPFLAACWPNPKFYLRKARMILENLRILRVELGIN
jgi:hypothetical protein